jgi:hypothetical protein
LDSVAVVAQTKLCLKHLSVSWCQISMSSLQELPNFKVDSPLGKSHNTLCKMHIQLRKGYDSGRMHWWEFQGI